jgi:hypothetical protein
MIGLEAWDSMKRELLAARARLWFERLLSELSANFINPPASRVDEDKGAAVFAQRFAQLRA